MASNKIQPTKQPFRAFVETVELAARRAEALALDALFQRETGFHAVMWEPSLVGYGRYHYRYPTGRVGDFLATGFSPRKAALSIHILPGYVDFGAILDDLGPHKLGRSCLYIKRLGDIDQVVLGRLIRAGLENLGQLWPVRPT